MEEIWKDIEGYEGLYQVSNLGEVRSIARIKEVTIKGTKIFQNYKQKLLSPGFSKSTGYLSVSLYDKDGEKKTHTVHRLVARHFVSNPLNLPEVNHIGKDENGNITKLDNRSVSLEWSTTRENALHGHASKYPGISWNNKRKKWVAFAFIKGKSKSLGRYNTQSEANSAYVKFLEKNGISTKYATAQ